MNIPSSPGGNNIVGPPTVDHSLPHGVSNMQEALANIDKKERDYEPAGGRRKRRRKSRKKKRKSRKKRRKSRRKRKKRRTRRR